MYLSSSCFESWLQTGFSVNVPLKISLNKYSAVLSCFLYVQLMGSKVQHFLCEGFVVAVQVKLCAF